MLPRVRHAATRNRIEKNKTTSGSYPLVGSFTKKQVSVQKNTFALDPGWGSPKKAVRATATKNNNRPPFNNKKRARNDKLKGTFGSPLCCSHFLTYADATFFAEKLLSTVTVRASIAAVSLACRCAPSCLICWL